LETVIGSHKNKHFEEETLVSSPRAFSCFCSQRRRNQSLNVSPSTLCTLARSHIN